jgi:hypothetical protein
MSYYTVCRDDSELRVVICPKCKQPDVINSNEVVPYKVGNWLLRLMQCNQCKTYFTFYREDGIKEISEDTAKNGLEKGCCDMNKDGSDNHKHSFYVIFKNKPATMSIDEYNELCGFNEDNDENYCDENKHFSKWVDCIPSINQLVRYNKMVKNIDFESMKYLEDYNNEWFE